MLTGICMRIDDLHSLGQLVERACSTFGSKPAFLVPINKKYVPTTYSEHWENVRRCAQCLRDEGVKKGDRVCIYGENSYMWALADWALFVLGAVPVPIYPSLPSDQAVYIVQDSEATLVLAGSRDAAQKVAPSGVKTILLQGEPGTLQDRLPTVDPIDPKSCEGLIEPDRAALATLIYTSGTTGNPKGAMLTHDNFLYMMEVIPSAFAVTESDVFMSFLPLSHVFERVNGHVLPMSLGATVGYVQSYATVASDFQAIRPTVMLTVPRFLDALRTRILDATSKAPPLRQKLFGLTVDQGTARMRRHPAPLWPILNKLVGSKVRERLGGRFRMFVSGGAALPAHVAEFFGAFDIPVYQGYGLTETTSGMSINRPESNDYRTIGFPIGGIEMKLAEDGEILIRGRCNMSGYYRLPEDTAAAIDAEGWFHTGDIGEADGKNFKITDRKKDLLILGNGKNVAPQPIENTLKESRYIEEVVLFGDGMEYVCGLVVPQWDAVMDFAKQHGLSVTTPEALVQEETVKKLIKQEIDKANKTLADFQKVKRHTLLAKSFSIEGGELTPSMKVKRKVVRAMYQAEIQAMGRS